MEIELALPQALALATEYVEKSGTVISIFFVSSPIDNVTIITSFLFAFSDTLILITVSLGSSLISYS